MKRNDRGREKSNSRRRAVTPPLKYSSLTARGRDAYDRTTNLITDLRRGDGSYTELRRKYHLASSTARKYARRDLVGGTRGKPLRAKKADRRVRDLLFPMPSGDVPIRTRNSRDATKLSDYYNDRDKLLGNKMSAGKFEAQWWGVSIDGREVFAHADAIFRMEDAGILDLKDLYSNGGPEK
jgi:hypothetical protein